MITSPQGPIFKQERWLTYLLCLLASCVLTALEVFYYYREGAVFLYILGCFAIGGGIYAWVLHDAKARGIRLTHNMKSAIGFLGPIAVPVYFVQSRGFKAAAKRGFGLILYVPFYGLYYGVWFVTVRLLKAVGYFS